MPHYHVRLSVAGQRHDETKTNLDSEQLQAQFLGPYEQGDPITVNGRSVSPENIERIRISQTDKPAEDYFADLRAKDASSTVVRMGGPSYAWRAAALGKDETDTLIKGPPGYRRDSGPAAQDTSAMVRRVTVPAGPGDGRSVFLVQGRNDAVNTAAADFLRSLDLKIVEWEQAVAATGEPNPYIGDVVSAGLEMADAVVVLATPDDLAHLDPALAADPTDDDITEAGQPRQNVLYEAGMAMALAPSRTLLVATPGTRMMSDLAGRHLVFLGNDPKSRKRIVGRLQTMGLAVDDSGDNWLSAGAF